MVEAEPWAHNGRRLLCAERRITADSLQKQFAVRMTASKGRRERL